MNDQTRGDRFAWGAETLLSQCAFCVHLSRTGDLPLCAAFPGGIPQAILANAWDHRVAWVDPATGEPGDTGVRGDESIVFEPRDSIPRDVLTHLYQVLEDNHVEP